MANQVRTGEAVHGPQKVWRATRTLAKARQIGDGPVNFSFHRKWP